MSTGAGEPVAVLAPAPYMGHYIREGKMGIFEYSRLDTCPHYKDESLGIFYCDLIDGKFPKSRCTGNPFMGQYKPRKEINGCTRYLENEGIGSS